MPATLFVRLAAAAGAAWPGYTRHDFVVRLARGDLPESAFRRYLVQDYLFLLHFARAWGLAVYKSDNLAEMRRAHALVAATLDVEIGLHVEYCRGWGSRWRGRRASSATPRSPPSGWWIRRRGATATPIASGSRCMPAPSTRASPATLRRRSTTSLRAAAARAAFPPWPRALPPLPGSRRISGRWVSMRRLVPDDDGARRYRSRRRARRPPHRRRDVGRGRFVGDRGAAR